MAPAQQAVTAQSTGSDVGYCNSGRFSDRQGTVMATATAATINE